MRRTIVKAIKEVMKLTGKPMTVSEVYESIIDNGLYIFNTDNPMHVVRSQIRRHCEGLDFPSAAPTKHFTMQNGSYWLLDAPIKESRKPAKPLAKTKTDLLADLKKLHQSYLNDFRQRLLDQIKDLDPASFELFSKRLLEAYGFKEVCVGSFSRDGGVDGYGKLKVGLAYINVAFQCKRWRKSNVPRPEIDKFRGAIQGKYEQGIFFTTAGFSKGAQDYSFQPGAVPIILIDGPAIIDFMLEKKFGIEVEYLPVHSNALDLILSEDE